MRRAPRTLIALGALSLLLSLLVAAPTSAASSYIEGDDAAATLYDPLKVNDIHLELSDANKELLSWDPKTYVPGKFSITIDGVTTGPLDVGIRIKGAWGSLRSIYQKCGFRIKLNFSVPGQKFMGLKKIVLNNMVQDASMIHEQLAYKFMRAVGVPSARAGYANVTVNDELYGLYLNLEAVDKTMLKRWYNGTSNLFEGAYWTDAIPEHFWQYELDEGPAIDPNTYTQSALWQFVNLQSLSGDAWFNAISQVADMRELTRLFAAELFISHWDGYTYSIWNNYYLHFDLDGKVTIIPSGMDQTWGGGYYNFIEPWGHGVLYQKCLEVTRCLQMYMGAVGHIKKVYESINLNAMASEIIPVIRDSVTADWKKEYSSDWTFYLQSVIGDVLINRTAGMDSIISDYKPGKPTATITRDKLVGTVSWNNVEPLYVPLVGHQVRISTNNSNWTTSEIIEDDNYQFELTPGATTYVRVKTINEVGESNWSNSVSVFTPALPLTPIPEVTQSGKDFQFTWPDLATELVQIDSFDIAISDDQTNWSFENQTELFTDFSLDFGETIFVKFRSVNEIGESGWTVPVKISLPLLPKVTKLNFAIKKKQVKVSWTAAATNGYEITGYQVSSSKDKIKWGAAKAALGTSVFFDQKAGKTLFYRIRVVTPLGTSAWSKPFKYARN